MVLSPEVVARLARLRLQTKVVVDGLFSGQHRSLRRGQSAEFAEHKEYRPGDELRHLDWKAFGRSDRYYVKHFEQEVSLTAYLLVDASRSMAYGPNGSKYERASLLASALATILTQQQDQVGLGLWTDDALTFVGPHRSPAHLANLFERLAEVVPRGATSLGALASQFAEKVHRRALVIVLSDFFDPAREGLSSLVSLATRGHDLVLIHLLDRTELEFPFADPTLFLAMEDAQTIQVNPRDLRQGYLAELQRFLDESERIALTHGCTYFRAVSDVPAEQTLTALLSRRSRRGGSGTQ